MLISLTFWSLMESCRNRNQTHFLKSSFVPKYLEIHSYRIIVVNFFYHSTIAFPCDVTSTTWPFNGTMFTNTHYKYKLLLCREKRPLNIIMLTNTHHEYEWLLCRKKDHLKEKCWQIHSPITRDYCEEKKHLMEECWQIHIVIRSDNSVEKKTV